MAKLLGIPPGQIKLPKAKPTGAIDPRKSLDSVTAAQLALNLPNSASRGNHKVTLLLPYGANNHFPQNSKEIKAFLDKRGERKNGGVADDACACERLTEIRLSDSTSQRSPASPTRRAFFLRPSGWTFFAAA